MAVLGIHERIEIESDSTVDQTHIRGLPRVEPHDLSFVGSVLSLQSRIAKKAEPQSFLEDSPSSEARLYPPMNPAPGSQTKVLGDTSTYPRP